MAPNKNSVWDKKGPPQVNLEHGRIISQQKQSRNKSNQNQSDSGFSEQDFVWFKGDQNKVHGKQNQSSSHKTKPTSKKSTRMENDPKEKKIPLNNPSKNLEHQEKIETKSENLVLNSKMKDSGSIIKSNGKNTSSSEKKKMDKAKSACKNEVELDLKHMNGSKGQDSISEELSMISRGLSSGHQASSGQPSNESYQPNGAVSLSGEIQGYHEKPLPLNGEDFSPKQNVPPQTKSSSRVNIVSEEYPPLPPSNFKRGKGRSKAWGRNSDLNLKDIGSYPPLGSDVGPNERNTVQMYRNLDERGGCVKSAPLHLYEGVSCVKSAPVSRSGSPPPFCAPPDIRTILSQQSLPLQLSTPSPLVSSSDHISPMSQQLDAPSCEIPPLLNDRGCQEVENPFCPSFSRSLELPNQEKSVAIDAPILTRDSLTNGTSEPIISVNNSFVAAATSPDSQLQDIIRSIGSEPREFPETTTVYMEPVSSRNTYSVSPVFSNSAPPRQEDRPPGVSPLSSNSAPPRQEDRPPGLTRPDNKPPGFQGNSLL